MKKLFLREEFPEVKVLQELRWILTKFLEILSVGSESRVKSESHSRWPMSDFCRLIRSAPEGLKRCLQSDAQGLSMAKREGKTYHVYQCHAGLIDIVFPVYVKEKYIAPLYIGQFLTAKPTVTGFAEIKKKTEDLNLDLKKLKQIYFHLPFIPQQTVEPFVKMTSRVVESFSHAGEGILLLRKMQKFPLVTMAEHYIIHNHSKSLTLEEVASHVSLSPWYFDRILKKKTGNTFTGYLNNVRIEKAKEMLTTTDLKIIDVGLDVGYQSISHFNRKFKEKTGVSPREFRKFSKRQKMQRNRAKLM